ncbi:hypothetical protein [Streptomyces sp. NPDC056387]|uniref:hypothetical protein n=1 Tax=Streptomyces sp. NPDC056387 TaxID=3345803 RepID=UPI0035DEB3C6
MSDQSGGPIGAARRAQAEREQRAAEPKCLMPGFMGCSCDHTIGCQDPRQTDPRPGRHTADTITDDELDDLYAERDANERRAKAYGQSWLAAQTRLKQAEQRAEQSAAAIARVRAAIASADWPHAQIYARAIRAALDEPKEPTP